MSASREFARDQLFLVVHQRGHQSGARDRVRLLEHQDAERERVDDEALGRRLGDELRHREAEDPTADARADDHEATPTLDPVEGGPHDGSHHGERGHGQEQEQEDVAAGGARRLGEEQGPGEGRRHARIGGDARGMGRHEPRERRRRQEPRVFGHVLRR